MPNQPLTRQQGLSIMKVVLVCMLLQLMLIGYVFYLSYQGRTEVVTAQRNGCERAKMDRNANAEGWRNAEEARRAEGQFDVAAEYARIASSLEARSSIDCEIVFPNPGVFP